LGHPEELCVRKTELPDHEVFRPSFGSPLAEGMRRVEVGPQNKITVISPRFLKGAYIENEQAKRPAPTRKIILAALNRFNSSQLSSELLEESLSPSMTHKNFY
ncbi:12324_t:CDS:2, partial [Acaulospora morrowiae]